MNILRKTTQNVDLYYWRKIHQILLDARENSGDLMSEAMNNSYGDDCHTRTKKEQAIITMYTKEIEEIDEILKYTTDNNGIPT